MLQDFNPRAPLGARRGTDRRVQRGNLISIHAPREGRDHSDGSASPSGKISIHAPREGRDRHAAHLYRGGLRFQSTRPARGATADGQPLVLHREHFNPRAPRGARPSGAILTPNATWISIHAPREGRDRPCPRRLTESAVFQSTRPARGATRPFCQNQRRHEHFNPRAPRGARPVSVWLLPYQI